MNNSEKLTSELLICCEKCQHKIEETWKKLVLADFESGMNKIVEIFDDLEKILNYIDSLNKIENYEYFNVQNFLLKLNNLEKSMNIPDYILVADILKYEIEVCILELIEKVTR